MNVSIYSSGLLLILATGCGPSPGPGARVFTPEAWKGHPTVVSDSSVYSLPGRVVAQDLDRDGDLDIAAVGPARLLWFEKRGETFHGHDIDEAGCANALLALDMDDDGWPDLVSAAGGPPDGRRMPGTLHWWRNPAESDRPWVRETLDNEPGNFLHDITMADLDNDGKVEIVAPRGAAYQDEDPAFNGLVVYAGKGSHWERIVLTSAEGKIEPADFSLSSGDVDGDGYADLVQYQTVWLNPGGAIRKPWKRFTWSGKYHPSNVVVRDMNSDGNLDIVFAEGHSHRAGSSRVGIWFNGTSRVEVLGRVPLDPENLVVADLDSNGVPDVVTGAMNWRSKDSPCWNAMHGTLVIFAGARNPFAWHRIEVRGGIAPLHHLSLVDMDGDGDLDVLAENTGAKPPPEPVVPSVQILWND